MIGHPLYLAMGCAQSAVLSWCRAHLAVTAACSRGIASVLFATGESLRFSRNFHNNPTVIAEADSS